MDKSTSKSALEVIQNPQKVLEILDKENSTAAISLKALPADLTTELANELVIAVAESTAQENTQFDSIYQAVKKKNAIPTRDMATALDYAGKAYEFVGNHWGEIFFILSYLDKKGYFNKLKEQPKFTTFFATLFDEELKQEMEEKEE